MWIVELGIKKTRVEDLRDVVINSEHQLCE